MSLAVFRRSVTVACSHLLALASIALFPLAFAPRVYADLHIDPDAPHLERWREIYSALPTAWHSQHVVIVCEVSPAAMMRLVSGNSHATSPDQDSAAVDGIFRAGDKPDDDATITLRDDLRADAAELVFAHEYAHFVWDKMMNVREQDGYRKIWRSQRHSGHLVTVYSRDSDAEGFAEAVAYYLRKPDVLRRRDHRSFDYLEALIQEMNARKAASETFMSEH